MKKASKKQSQKRAAKARKQLLDKQGEAKQQEITYNSYVAKAARKKQAADKRWLRGNYPPPRPPLDFMDGAVGWTGLAGAMLGKMKIQGR